MTETQVIFYGIATRYVYDALEVAERARLEVRAFVHNLADVPPPTDLDPVVRPEEMGDELKRLPVVFPLITPGYRKKLEASASAKGLINFGSLIDPSAILPKRLTYAEGLHINAGVIIGSNCRLGRQVLINRGASLGHDLCAEDYVSFGPSCILCGSCTIGAGAFIGAGAVITPKIRVGRNAVVGAGAVVPRNVPSNTIVAGNPARVIREQIAGYNEVGV